uniref:Uncharacterized protein n=1 Tax=Globisporangium ultimum (strain ATCC 200006 / CBS 805.95 / DAOM BR144) TaxID=431595 RepID=K3W7C8_GLOUD
MELWLCQKAEKDFIGTHKELEATQLQLMECKRKMAEKEHEVRTWIERYEQVMMDLHVSQFRLMQMARGWALLQLARGYAVDLNETSADITHIHPRAFPWRKEVSASDRAVRKYRQDLIPNRSKQTTASLGASAHSQPLPPRLHASRSAGALQGNNSSCHHPDPLGSLPAHTCTSRDCFQCTNANVNAANPVVKPKKLGTEISRIDPDA